MRLRIAFIFLLSGTLGCSGGDTLDFTALACSQYLDLTGTDVRALAGDDRFLYVGHAGGLRAYELLSTMSPDPETQQPYRLRADLVSNAPHALAVDGTTLVVAESDRVAVYDTSQVPPVLRGTVAAGAPLDVAVAGGGWFLFADAAGGVTQVDVRDPEKPAVTNHVNPAGDGPVTQLARYGARFFALNGGAAVHAYRIGDDGAIFPEAGLPVSFVPEALVVAGDRLVAGGKGRVAVFDLAAEPVRAVGERSVDVSSLPGAGPFELSGRVAAGYGGRAIGRAGGFLVAVQVSGDASAQVLQLPCTGSHLDPGRLVVVGDRLVILDATTQRLTGLFPGG